MYSGLYLILITSVVLIAMVSGFIINIKNIDLGEHASLLLTANVLAAVLVVLLVTGLAVPETVRVGVLSYIDFIIILAAIILTVIFSIYTFCVINSNNGKPFLISAATFSLVGLSIIIIIPTTNKIRSYISSAPITEAVQIVPTKSDIPSSVSVSPATPSQQSNQRLPTISAARPELTRVTQQQYLQMPKA